MVSRILLCLTFCGSLYAAEDLVGQARQAQVRGDYRSAAEAWRKIVATDPDNPVYARDTETVLTGFQMLPPGGG